MNYKQTSGGWIVRLDDDGNAIASIPVDSENADYQEFIAWEAQGNTALPADPPGFDFASAGRARQERIIKRLAASDPIAAIKRKEGW